MSILDIFLGRSYFLVGVADDPQTGGVRAYLNARWKGIYVVVTDDRDKEMLRREWANTHGHIFIGPENIDPDGVFTEKERP